MMWILHSYHAAQYVALIMMCILTSHHTAPCVSRSSSSLVSSKCFIELKGHHPAHLQHHTFLISSSSPSAFCIPVACLFLCLFAFFGVGSFICLLSLAFVHLLVCFSEQLEYWRLLLTVFNCFMALLILLVILDPHLTDWPVKEWEDYHFCFTRGRV
jgi:hypothetical protein